MVLVGAVTTIMTISQPRVAVDLKDRSDQDLYPAGMSDVEVRQLRYFVAVAEELHFGRAAARLGMAQPPLSRAIRDLERQLGVRLLERTTRRVVLTPAGAVLLREARAALDAVTAAVRRARHAGQAAPVLHVALKADFDAGLLPQIIAAYEGEETALPVQVVLGGYNAQVPAVRDGRADVALLFMPFADPGPDAPGGPGPDGAPHVHDTGGPDLWGLDVEPLLTEPRLVALAATDPLAVRPSLCLADLAGRMLPDGTAAEHDGRHTPAAARHNGHRRSEEADRRPVAEAPPTGLDLAQIFNLIELGRMVWFPPASVARRHSRPTIAYRAVDDLRPATLAVAWPHASHSPAVAAFVRAATTVAAAHTAGDPLDGGPQVERRGLRAIKPPGDELTAPAPRPAAR
jgi:DNA-binding transcriptional LysR family regulator